VIFVAPSGRKEDHVTERTTKRSRVRRFFAFAAVPALAGLGLLFAGRVYAFGPFHGGCRHHGAESAEEVRDHLDRRVEHVLDEVDASEAQRAQVDALLDAAAPQLFALMAEGRSLRGEVKQALLADEVDHARIQKAQAALDGLAQRASKLGLGTLAQVADVLTPAQRREVADKLARFHHD
jgi:Spy/CpxP family protein refolding chaperone